MRPSLFQNLQSLIALHPVQELSLQLNSRACVAVILRGSSVEQLEIGYIRRAESPGDRWSGQIAFPGGLFEKQDADDLATVLREVREELGIGLYSHELVGRLSDLQARNRLGLLDLFIRPFVFHVEREFELSIDSSEVAEFFWFPVAELIAPQRQTEIHVEIESSGEQSRDNSRISLPAIALQNTQPPLWGLTLMMTHDLLLRLRPRHSD
jgi:8-oxo-dGTP pyrophosphatase MutT (NUDIX family)